MVLNVKLDQKHWFGWFTGKFFRAPKNPPGRYESIPDAFASALTSRLPAAFAQVIHRPVAASSGDHSKKMMQPALTAEMPRAYRHGMTKIEEITAEEFCRFRAAHDVGQRKVAEWFGVNQATVHRWEQRGLRGVATVHVRAVMKRKKPKMAVAGDAPTDSPTVSDGSPASSDATTLDTTAT